MGDHRVGIFGELAAIGHLAVFEHQETGQRGDRILPGKGAVRVEKKFDTNIEPLKPIAVPRSMPVLKVVGL